MKVTLILLSFLGLILSETLSAKVNPSEDSTGNLLYTQYRSAKRINKTPLEIRHEQALMRRNKERRPSSSRIRNQEVLKKNLLASSSDDKENDFMENRLPKPSHKLSSKFIGYYCPMGANSNGNGLAIIQADPYDCSGYFYCAWGIYKPSQCTWPLLWNDEIKACDWYFNVDCGNRPFQRAAN